MIYQKKKQQEKNKEINIEKPILSIRINHDSIV